VPPQSAEGCYQRHEGRATLRDRHTCAWFRINYLFITVVKLLLDSLVLTVEKVTAARDAPDKVDASGNYCLKGERTKSEK